MAAFTGEIFTTSKSEGAPSIDSVEQINVIMIATQESVGNPILMALAGSGINPLPHYALSCYDDVNVRHYWVDTAISLTNAPPGFTYVSATLTVIGKF